VAGLGNSEETAAPTPPAQQAASGEAGGGAVPARAESAQPAGTSTGGIAPGAVRLRLGRFDAPATDAIARTGVSEDVPLPAGFPPREAVRSLSLTREGLAPFRAVGVTWSGHAGAVSVAVRGRAGPGGWGAWQAAAPSGGFEGAGAGVRDGAQLVWLAPSDAVQVMLAGTGESAPEDVTVDLIDPREAPGDSVPVPPVTTASVDLSRVGRPPIHTRAEWGADERLMTWPPQYAPTVRALAWHEQPVGGDYAEVDVPRILRALYYYDAVSRGWGDVGDNVVVDRFGRLWEGRYGGLSRAVTPSYPVPRRRPRRRRCHPPPGHPRRPAGRRPPRRPRRPRPRRPRHRSPDRPPGRPHPRRRRSRAGRRPAGRRRPGGPPRRRGAHGPPPRSRRPCRRRNRRRYR
jgi:hypothetical protein